MSTPSYSDACAREGAAMAREGLTRYDALVRLVRRRLSGQRRSSLTLQMTLAAFDVETLRLRGGATG